MMHRKGGGEMVFGGGQLSVCPTGRGLAGVGPRLVIIVSNLVRCC